jgi:hypothetical protein
MTTNNRTTHFVHALTLFVVMSVPYGCTPEPLELDELGSETGADTDDSMPGGGDDGEEDAEPPAPLPDLGGGEEGGEGEESGDGDGDGESSPDVCGDGVVGPTEQCDVAAPEVLPCPGGAPGLLFCRADCTFGLDWCECEAGTRECQCKPGELCGDGLICDAGVCVPPEPPLECIAAGEPCLAVDLCCAGSICQEDGAGGAYICK